MKTKSISALLTILVMTITIQGETPNKSEALAPAAGRYAIKTRELAELKDKANNGDANAAYRIALHYLLAMNAISEARPWLERAARGGVRDAQYNLGLQLFQEG